MGERARTVLIRLSLPLWATAIGICVYNKMGGRMFVDSGTVAIVVGLALCGTLLGAVRKYVRDDPAALLLDKLEARVARDDENRSHLTVLRPEGRAPAGPRQATAEDRRGRGGHQAGSR